MYFQTPGYKFFLIGFIAFALASCDQNNATSESQTEEMLKTLSLEELKTKAENQDPAALYELGSRYFNGEGVSKDYAEAMRWVRLAAEQGHSEAQYHIAANYYRDLNYPEAMHWWRLAADQGHAFAQFNLGGLYHGGEVGVPDDMAKAIHWYSLSADQGHPGAQVNLGFIYRSGIGVPQNFVTAYMWFSLASAQGDSMASNNKNKLSDKMTPEQIAEGERLTQKWLAEHQ